MVSEAFFEVFHGNRGILGFLGLRSARWPWCRALLALGSREGRLTCQGRFLFRLSELLVQDLSRCTAPGSEVSEGTWQKVLSSLLIINLDFTI